MANERRAASGNEAGRCFNLNTFGKKAAPRERPLATDEQTTVIDVPVDDICLVEYDGLPAAQQPKLF
jgi:hypothetical protein